MKEIILSKRFVFKFKLFELDKETRVLMGTKYKYFATDGKQGYFSNNQKRLFSVFGIIYENDTILEIKEEEI